MHEKIIFGLQLGDQQLPRSNNEFTGGEYLLGPTGLLQYLESKLGLSGHPGNNDHIRTEQYRQALNLCVDTKAAECFRRSFEADPFATATALLELRDELLLGGWDFSIVKNMPARLLGLATIEEILTGDEHTIALDHGFADRFQMVRERLDWLLPDFPTLYLNEPKELLPPAFIALFDHLEKLGFSISNLPVKVKENKVKGNADTDLDKFKKAIQTSGAKKFTPTGDGSLLIIKAKRDTELAAWMAKLIAKDPDFEPACLIPEKNRTLDLSLSQEGLPSLGMLSASSARPSLQILKLVPTFLWNPVDPYKIMEFVTLAVKPLSDELAVKIARQMAATPGLRSDSWYAMQQSFFENLEERAQGDKNINVGAVREQYNFWFNRKRYSVSKSVPKTEVVEIYDYIADWARQEFADTEEENTSLLVLAEQAKRIVDLLFTLPPNMDFLTPLQLERIVRTIYEPAPITFEEQAIGHLPYTYQPASIVGSLDHLLWWNFIQNEPDHFFSRWYPSELQFFNQTNTKLSTPEKENELLLWQRNRPVIHTSKQLILCIPEKVKGSEVHAHPLFDELNAYTIDLANISLDINKDFIPPVFTKNFALPVREKIPYRKLARPQLFLEIDQPGLADQNEKESFTSLNDLFYYPYQWVFRHKARLQASSILSIVKDVTLMGNLSHRFFELLFKENITKMDRAAVAEWIDISAPDLLKKEGAVLLMYGREPEKISFLNKVKYSAWSLIEMIQQNGWKVQGTEIGLGGKFADLPVSGKADLVLERNGEIAVIDLKWRGATRRTGLIKSEEDLQLVMYSRLLSEDDEWGHTAYFILENGKMIARNNQAFKQVLPISPDQDFREVNQRIWEKMIRTYEWRLQQLANGKVEVRTSQTAEELEETYGNQLAELLEMSDKDAPFDDYRTLINVED